MASKKKLEEQRRKEEEEERLAAAHKEFLESFSDAPKLDKTWVRAGTAESERRGEKSVKREIYKPTSKLAELAGTFKSHQTQPKEEYAPPKPDITTKKKQGKLSNLEKFKEELRVLQQEREERKRLRDHIKECEEKGIAPTLLTSSGKPSRFEATDDLLTTLETSSEKEIYGGSSKAPFDNDQASTNIYCGNISPKMTEQDLCEVFGKFGPLASVKIMYPRTEEERAKNRNTGFVGFMKRSDAEDAFDTLKGETIMGYEMRLSWGKCIPIPPRPIYVPPSMVKEVLPPPPSGLPFNAQPPNDWEPSRDRYGNPDFTKNLDQTEVKIVTPTDRLLLCLIHRMVEYVVREGPLFEAMIMNREMNNPRFRFLFDNQLPAHTYYRWKLFSILQGDEPHIWRVKPFQMFADGPYWVPPKMNPYMVKQIKDGDKQEAQQTNSSKKNVLSERQRDKLGDILRDISIDRVRIGSAMVWCLEHADAAEEIVEILTDSLGIPDTPLQKKLARLYVISDILHNSSVKLPNVSYFRKYFEPALPTIFKSFNEVYEAIDGRLTAENFKQKIMSCFRTWEGWAIYPLDHLIRCQNIFLGLLQDDEDDDEDVDGAPISPSHHQTQEYAETRKSNISRYDDDIDGAPIDDDIDGEPIMKGKLMDKGAFDDRPKFAASKWETIDEDVVKAQAMTTSKWEALEEPEERDSGRNRRSADDIDGEPINSSSDDDDVSFSGSMSGLSALSAAYTPKQKRHNLDMNEQRRARLREIEMKVVKYQDELESGKRPRKSHASVADQVEAYRRKLLQKEQDEADREVIDSPSSRGDRRRRSKSSSPSRRRRSRSASSSRSRSNRSSKRSRSRSRSPKNKRNKRSRSRSKSLEKQRSRKYR